MEKIFNNGKSVPINSVQENSGVHNIHEIYAEYNKGSTVILRGLQHRWKLLADFYRSLETFFNHRVHINMYMTPSNSQDFTPHFDTHEVLILQI
ncbi:hypothetical protein H6G97_26155 [Nostoc flagelliforme FACHB-838]|uniref:JmjC domain-containing protein n=1 Tax=Nostoc flagelliforme FACHB-838 TaxID=2692904 RepID=A0ABR8DUN9_9NOSO|nr:hypothetical protein [Nostoc flagelliforme FACHB-838]